MKYLISIGVLASICTIWTVCGAPDAADEVAGAGGPATETAVVPNAGQCSDWTQCAHPKMCMVCEDGMAPACAAPACVGGQCEVVAPCSLPIQCTASLQCTRPHVCRACPAGYGPTCATAECINNLCIQIQPCSRKW